MKHFVHLGLALFTFLLSEGAGAQEPQPRMIRTQARFGLRVDAAGGNSVLLYDPAGNVTGTVPAEGRSFQPGPGDYFALVARDPDRTQHQVTLHDATGAVVSRFEIPRSRVLLVGRESIVLQPWSDIDASSYDIEFRDLSGESTGETRWTLREDVLAVAGDALAFSPGGGVLHVLSQERKREGPERVWLRTYEDLDGQVTGSERFLDQVPPARGLEVYSFEALPDGRVTVVTSHGNWVLGP
jgi:hypothetical protein